MTTESPTTLEAAKNIIEDQQDKLKQAGINGNALLERVSYLDDQLNDIHMKHAKELEAMEQEKYALEMKIELMTRNAEELEGNLQEDRKQHKAEIEKLLEKDQMQHKTEISYLKQKIGELEHNLEHEKLQNTQNAKALEASEKAVKELKRETANIRGIDTNSISGEVSNITMECMQLRELLDERTEELIAVTKEHEHLLLQLKRQKVIEEELTEEKNSAQKQSIANYRKLEQAREEMEELRVQLDAFQASNPNSTGNSLFAEVDDRRVVAEKRFINMKVRYKQMSAKMEQQSKYIYTLKAQIGNLLHARASAYDRERICQLNGALDNARNESEMRMREIIKLKQELADKMDNTDNETTSNDERVMVNFYKDKYKRTKTELEETKSKLDRSQLSLIMESGKVDRLLTQCNEKQHQIDCKVAENFKKQAEVYRLKILCGEEVEEKKSQPKMTCRTEVINFNKSQESKNTKESEMEKSENIPVEKIECKPKVPLAPSQNKVNMPKSEDDCRQM